MKICVRCLTLHKDADVCPACGIGLVEYGLWRKHQGAVSEIVDAHESAEALETAEVFPAADPNPTAADARPGHRGVQVVLGIFLSFLAFFVAFLAAYVTVEFTK